MPVQPLPCTSGGGSTPSTEGCCSPSTTSTPVCLADGTPVLLLVRSPCVCGGAPDADPAVVGWLDTGHRTVHGRPTARRRRTLPQPGRLRPSTDVPPTPRPHRPRNVDRPRGHGVRIGDRGVRPGHGDRLRRQRHRHQRVRHRVLVVRPGSPCAPGVLCGSLAVDVPDGAAAYIQWSAPCGDES
ncbi:hypothetical protein E4K10_30675 [Streptomyces sp. T1317-0309]|nr:hypothetical protein E4K10_30675 [Streptomyces sp. T1317-0309]